MNRLLLLALLMFLAASNYAQISSPIEVTTKDGQIVILKPNGTWEFKKVVPQQTPTANTSSPKQNIGSYSLPPNFKGHSLVTLSNKFVYGGLRPIKDEFETAAEYEKRAAQAIKKPIYDDLTLKDTFSLVFNIVATYNADLQEMTLSLPFSETIKWAYNSNRDTKLASIRDKIEAKDLADVNHYEIKSEALTAIFFDDANSLKLQGELLNMSFSTKILIGGEDARRLKQNAKAIVLVQFQEPYYKNHYYAGGVFEQFQVRVIDVYFFDSQTGEILVKLSESKK